MALTRPQRSQVATERLQRKKPEAHLKAQTDLLQETHNAQSGVGGSVTRAPAPSQQAPAPAPVLANPSPPPAKVPDTDTSKSS